MTEVQQPIKVYTYNSDIHKRLMKEDPVYKEYITNQARLAMVRRYQTDEEFRERQKQMKRDRYHNDPVYRESVLEKVRFRNIKVRKERERKKAETVVKCLE